MLILAISQMNVCIFNDRISLWQTLMKDCFTATMTRTEQINLILSKDFYEFLFKRFISRMELWYSTINSQIE